MWSGLEHSARESLKGCDGKDGAKDEGQDVAFQPWVVGNVEEPILRRNAQHYSKTTVFRKAKAIEQD